MRTVVSTERQREMNTLKRLFHFSQTRSVAGTGSSRFERYYGAVLRSGEGYPTADEARQDLKRYERSFLPYGWPR